MKFQTVTALGARGLAVLAIVVGIATLTGSARGDCELCGYCYSGMELVECCVPQHWPLAGVDDCQMSGDVCVPDGNVCGIED
jgi:hypothetical protein